MTADEERERWEMQPDVGVGPLRFGMSPAEVAQALLVSGPQSRVGGDYGQENFPGGVRAFYDEGKLACVALDAVAHLDIRCVLPSGDHGRGLTHEHLRTPAFP